MFKSFEKVTRKLILLISTFLLIAPKDGQKNGKIFYGKIILGIIIHAIFVYIAITDSGTTYFNSFSKNFLVKNFLTFSALIGYFIVISTFWSYSKNDLWQQFYKKILIRKENRINAGVTFSFWIIHIIVLIVLTIQIHGIIRSTNFLNNIEKISRIIFTFCHWVQHYYVAIITLLMVQIIEMIKRDIILMEKHFCGKATKVFNINLMKQKYVKILESVQYFNTFFGFPLIFIFGQWIIFIVCLAVSFTLILNSNNNNNSNNAVVMLGTEYSSIEIKLIALFDFIYLSIAPCIVAFNCDGVVLEAEKLLICSHESQQKFQYFSYEYQELEIFKYFITKNRIEFTGADFFKIERSTLLSVAATCTTYFIALIQFSY